MNSIFSKYLTDLKKENLTNYSDLVKLVSPLGKKAGIMTIKKAEQPNNSQLLSQFGGEPYFEEEESWPATESGRKLDFVFQVFNNDTPGVHENIRLIQFFCDIRHAPWNTKGQGWNVKVYTNLNLDKIISIPKPPELTRFSYCDIGFNEIMTFPDWQSISTICENADKLSCVLNEDQPSGNYESACNELNGENGFQSQLGGYPTWLQGDGTPKKSNGEPMDLLFQLDSEEAAGLMWHDYGLIYVFYDSETNKVEFVLQCM